MLPPHDEWVGGNSAGPHTSTVDKLLIHTTEGSSIAGAIAAYRANNSWPHLTVDCQLGRTPRRCGHLDMAVAARALRNEPGGVQTNTDGVIQIEVVGQAVNPAGIDWVWFGANVVAHICRGLNIPLASQVPWVAYPASYGIRATQRLSPEAWTAVRGIVGHQHVPENSHGDPGAIPIATILTAAGATLEPPTPQEVVVNPTVAQEPTYGKVVVLWPSREYEWINSWESLVAVVDGLEGAGIDVEYNGRQTVAGVSNVPAPRPINQIAFDRFKPARPGVDDADPSAPN